MKKTIILLALTGIVITSCKNNHSHNHSDMAYNHTHAPTNYFGSYTVEDENYGTKTTVIVGDEERTMVTNALPNHKTGSFPNAGNPNTIAAQNSMYTFPVIPKYTGKAQWIREPGVALNGVKFEPGTAEVVICETGENYRVEAFQNLINLGLDFNHAHVQPNGAYHYHGTPTSVIDKFDNGKDLVHVGFAHDGFPMYYSKSGKYKPSFRLIDGIRTGEDCTYENPMERMDISVGGHHDGTYGSDFEYVDGLGDLDECNGITIDGVYMYLVTNEFPYVSRCLMGEFESQERSGPPQGRRQANGGMPGKRPTVKELLHHMDADKDKRISIKEAKGPLKEKFTEVDTNKDGFISKQELEKDLAKHKGGGN